VIAVIGDSTFLHSGINGLLNAVYYESHITVIILDNETTAMTGHQNHPGTGISAQGKKAGKVDLESLIRGSGVVHVEVLDAFNLDALKKSVKNALSSTHLSVLIVRGKCAVQMKTRSEPRMIDINKCNACGMCLLLGCSAIQKHTESLFIDSSQCVGQSCRICEQLCARGAIGSQEEIAARGSK